MLEYITGTGKKRKLSGWVKWINDAVAVATVIFVIVSVFLYPEALLYRSVCFALFFFNIFIAYTAPNSNTEAYVPVYDYVLAVLSLGVGVYFVVNIDRIVTRLAFVDMVLTGDIILGILAILLLLEGCRRVLGSWLPALSILSLLYLFYGHYIIGRFGHQVFNIKYIIDGMFLSSYGIWGSTFGIAVGQVMVFLIFASFFQKSGAADFLFDFAASIAGASEGGVAKIAIITSALFGMISGGPVTDVTTTGTMTIPAMKKQGYPAAMAGAIESCACVGAVFMPPIMGSIAFIMAEVVGIPYGEVAKRAFIPAILYFAVVFFIVHFRSKKLGIGGFAESDRKPLRSLKKQCLTFFVPLTYLTFRLISGIFPERAALESVVVILIINLLQNRRIMALDIIWDTMVSAVQKGRTIVSTMAACGIFVSVVMITGLTSKMGSYLNHLSSYSSLIILIVVIGVVLFLGLAMNGTSSYLITAVICAPTLIRQGFPPLGVHMFCLYFAAMSTLTPPVALTTYTAATIAEAPPGKVTTEAMKMAFTAIVLPFAFVYNPSILLYGPWWTSLISFVSAMIGTVLVASAMENWWFGVKLNILVRGCILIAGSALIIGKSSFIIGAVPLLLIVYLYTLYIKKKFAKVI